MAFYTEKNHTHTLFSFAIKWTEILQYDINYNIDSNWSEQIELGIRNWHCSIRWDTYIQIDIHILKNESVFNQVRHKFTPIISTTITETLGKDYKPPLTAINTGFNWIGVTRMLIAACGRGASGGVLWGRGGVDVLSSREWVLAGGRWRLQWMCMSSCRAASLCPHLQWIIVMKVFNWMDFILLLLDNQKKKDAYHTLSAVLFTFQELKCFYSCHSNLCPLFLAL